jgi:DNA excision repair protein ERCC-2
VTLIKFQYLTNKYQYGIHHTGMRFDLEGLDVFFPYDFLYREQYEYMLNLKRAIDDKGHALLEMPTGTGKTVCLISLITSYQYQFPHHTGKLIYW